MNKIINLADESEISINDIIHFFFKYWKLLLIGATIGLLFAVAVTLKFGRYEAQATIVNKAGIDYLGWSMLRKNLPILAYQITSPSINEDSYLNDLSSEFWWQKNVTPTFSFSKTDSKEGFGVTKELQDSEATKISNFIIKATGSSKELALANLLTATSFIRSGSIYLVLKDYLTGLRVETLNSESEIEKNIFALEIELTYLNRRIGSLESLRAKFPDERFVNSQVIDLKDSISKYLPLSTQLVAANQDIGNLKENLSRLNDKKAQLIAISGFLSQANPVIESNFDWHSALVKIVQIEAGLRKKLKPSDTSSIQVFNKIKHELALIHTKFSVSLEQPTFISTSSPKYLRNGAFGLFGGFFIALIVAFFSVIRPRYNTPTLN